MIDMIDMINMIKIETMIDTTENVWTVEIEGEIDQISQAHHLLIMMVED